VSDTAVSRDTVIKALKASNVDISRDGDKFTLAKEGVPIETLVLPQAIEKKMLFRFQYRYGVPIHWFFHPEMIPKT
jgi:hypothetical protein